MPRYHDAMSRAAQGGRKAAERGKERTRPNATSQCEKKVHVIAASHKHAVNGQPSPLPTLRQHQANSLKQIKARETSGSNEDRNRTGWRSRNRQASKLNHRAQSVGTHDTRSVPAGNCYIYTIKKTPHWCFLTLFGNKQTMEKVYKLALRANRCCLCHAP